MTDTRTCAHCGEKVPLTGHPIPASPESVSGEERCTCEERGLTAHKQGCVIFTLPEAERIPFLFEQYQASRRPEVEEVAKRFHEAYERLAPSFAYTTRRASAVPWEQVPENNRRLMIAVSAEVLASLCAPKTHS